MRSLKLHSRLEVRRFKWVRYGREAYRGGYCEDQGCYQVLERVWRLFGYVIWRTELDREEVPMHVLIASGCLGHSGWKSKFYSILQGGQTWPTSSE